MRAVPERLGNLSGSGKHQRLKVPETKGLEFVIDSCIAAGVIKRFSSSC
jgi:hypothetical protein